MNLGRLLETKAASIWFMDLAVYKLTRFREKLNCCICQVFPFAARSSRSIVLV